MAIEWLAQYFIPAKSPRAIGESETSAAIASDGYANFPAGESSARLTVGYRFRAETRIIGGDSHYPLPPRGYSRHL